MVLLGFGKGFRKFSKEIGSTSLLSLWTNTDALYSKRSSNLTNRMITLVNKLFNKVPTLLQDIKLGIINKPLSEYTAEFEEGLIDAGDYINGIPTEDASSVSIIDSSTYSPLTDQDTVVDSDLYINI